MKWLYDDGGRAASGFRGEAGDCSTRAIAIATGRSYSEVYTVLGAMANERLPSGRKRYSARTGVPRKTIRAYLANIGWVWTPTMHIGSGCKVHLREEELPRGRLVVSVSRHLVAVIDGVIRDTHDPTRAGVRCVYGYWQPGAMAERFDPALAPRATP